MFIADILKGKCVAMRTESQNKRNIRLVYLTELNLI